MVKSRLRPGSAAFNVPKSMVVGQTATVRLSMNRQAGSAAPAATVDTLDGSTVIFAPMVGQFMRAELSASPSTAFVIKASRAERQDLGAADSAVWEWSVTAKEEGQPRLIVRTWVVLDASSETPVSITENPRSDCRCHRDAKAALADRVR